MSSNEEKKLSVGRPKSEEKRCAILLAAGQEFLESGYEGTSIDRIAEGAGVSKATVYSHFKNKEQLFEAVIHHKVESYDFGEDDGPELEDIKAGLEYLAMRFYELLNDPEVISMHRMVIGESQRHCEMAKLFYKNGPEKTKKAVAAYLDKQTRQKQLKIHDTSQAASQYLYMVAGEMLMRSMLNVPFNITKKAFKQHVSLTTEQFLRIYQQ